MNTFILTLGTILVALLVALFAVPPLVDWNTYRGVFEEEASRILGRDVRVSGDVKLRLLPSPFIQFESVTIAAEDGVTGEPFLRANSFTMQLSAPPLLSGIIEARKIDIADARLRLRIDEDGRGNWQRFQLGRGSLSVVPRAVSLQQVSLSNATIVLENASRGEMFRVERIAGDLSSPSMNGPFRFVGTADLAGAERTVRFATSRWSAEAGATDIKLDVRGPHAGQAVSLSGQLIASEDEAHRFDGEVTARVSPQIATSGTARPVEIKSSISFDTRQVVMDDLVVSFDQIGRPQLLTGRADYQHSDNPELQVTLQSRWLDLDAITGAPGAASDSVLVEGNGQPSGGANAPQSVLAAAQLLLRQLKASAVTELPATRFDLSIDQTTVAGKSLSDIQINMSVKDGQANLERFVALAPGGTTIRLDGTMSLAASAGKPHAFDGHVLIAGANLSRFARWAWPQLPATALTRSRRFTSRSNIRLRDTSFSFTDAQLRVGDTSLNGHGSIGLDEVGALVLDVGGPKIDLRMIDREFNLAAAFQQLISSGSTVNGTGTVAGSRAGVGGAKFQPLNLKVQAGALTDATGTFRDVRFDLSRSGQGTLAIRDINLSTARDARLSLKGELDAPGSAGGRGRLLGTATAKDRSASRELYDLISEVVGATDWIGRSGLPALDTSFFVEFGAPDALDGSETNANLTIAQLKGRVGRDLVGLEVRSSAALQNWASSPLSLSLDATLSGGNGLVEVLRGLGLSRKSANLDRGSQGTSTASDLLDGARLTLSAEGIARDGLMTFMAIERAGEQISYRGSVEVGKGGRSAFDGRLQLKDAKVETLADLAGWRQVPPVIAALTADGLVSVRGQADDSVWKLEHVLLDGGPVHGDVRVASKSSDLTAISGSIAVDSLSLERAMPVILAAEDVSGAAGRQVSQASGVRVGRSIWPQARFDADRLNGLSIAIDVRSQRLRVAPDAELRDVAFKLRASDSQIRFDNLQATSALGGQVQSDIGLKSVPGGYLLDGRIEVAGLDLSRAAPSTASATGTAGGQAWVKLQFRGEGVSPRAVVSLATGKGQLRIRRLSTTGVDPAGIGRAIVGLEDIGVEELNAALRTELLVRQTALGSRKVELNVRDGVVFVPKLSVRKPTGTVTNDTVFDMSTLEAESRWRIQPALDDKPPAGEPAIAVRPWPAIEVIYSAPLVGIMRTEPKIEASALARELVVRRMEGSVAELERLRREDAERAVRLEEERRRQEAARELERAERERALQERLIPGIGSGSAPVLRAPLPLPPALDRRSRLRRQLHRQALVFARGKKPATLPTDISPYSPLYWSPQIHASRRDGASEHVVVVPRQRQASITTRRAPSVLRDGGAPTRAKTRKVAKPTKTAKPDRQRVRSSLPQSQPSVRPGRGNDTAASSSPSRSRINRSRRSALGAPSSRLERPRATPRRRAYRVRRHRSSPSGRPSQRQGRSAGRRARAARQRNRANSTRQRAARSNAWRANVFSNQR